MERACWRCHAPIHLCMGFVGGDLAALMRGEEPKVPIFETCGKCALLWIICEEFGLPKPYVLPSEKTAP